MKKKICLSICLIMILFTLGCEYKTKERDLVKYLDFRFKDVELEHSEIYYPKEGTYTDGSERYSYQIFGVIDVSINDDVDTKFQVYEYNICRYDECEKKTGDNYDYVYGNYLIKEYNKEHESDPLYLDMNTDNLGGKYFVNNIASGLMMCESGIKLEGAKKKLDEFKEFVNSKTKRTVSFNVQLYCEEEVDYSIN